MLSAPGANLGVCPDPGLNRGPLDQLSYLGRRLSLANEVCDVLYLATTKRANIRAEMGINVFQVASLNDWFDSYYIRLSTYFCS